MRVPRWRTMIVPASTISPSKRFTPSRWPESRARSWRYHRFSCVPCSVTLRFPSFLVLAFRAGFGASVAFSHTRPASGLGGSPAAVWAAVQRGLGFGGCLGAWRRDCGAASAVALGLGSRLRFSLWLFGGAALARSARLASFPPPRFALAVDQDLA